MEETGYVLEVIAAIEAAGLPYMLVGAFSTGAYGIPRSTKDADLVVALAGLKVSEITNRLDARFQLDPQVRFESVTGKPRRILRIANSPFTVELFPLSQDEHDQQRFGRRRLLDVPQLGRAVYLPAPED